MLNFIGLLLVETFLAKNTKRLIRRPNYHSFMTLETRTVKAETNKRTESVTLKAGREHVRSRTTCCMSSSGRYQQGSQTILGDSADRLCGLG